MKHKGSSTRFKPSTEGVSISLVSNHCELKKDSNLAGLSDSELVGRVKTLKCDHSFIELKARHQKSIYRTMHKYKAVIEGFGGDFEEVLNSDNFIMMDSLVKLDVSKSSFLTFVTNMTRFFCLNLIKDLKDTYDHLKVSVNSSDIDEEGMYNFEKELSGTHDNRQEREIRFNDDINLVNKISHLFDKKTKEILNLKYSRNKIYSWSNISEMTGLPASSCQKLHVAALSKIKEKMLELREIAA